MECLLWVHAVRQRVVEIARVAKMRIERTRVAQTSVLRPHVWSRTRAL